MKRLLLIGSVLAALARGCAVSELTPAFAATPPCYLFIAGRWVSSMVVPCDGVQRPTARPTPRPTPKKGDFRLDGSRLS